MVDAEDEHMICPQVEKEKNSFANVSPHRGLGHGFSLAQGLD